MSAIDELLHDAEGADAGIGMARMMRDSAAVKRLTEKRDKCIADALALDPSMSDGAWGEGDPRITQLAKGATP